jgi:hypothetical protein
LCELIDLLETTAATRRRATRTAAVPRTSWVTRNAGNTTTTVCGDDASAESGRRKEIGAYLRIAKNVPHYCPLMTTAFDDE